MTTPTIRLISFGQARELTRGIELVGLPEAGGTFYNPMG